LNDTVHDLDENGVTQLVAACGAGKTRMGQQIARWMMSEPGASHIGVVLTSSVELARQISGDYRKDGIIQDGAEIVEIHNEASAFKTDGKIDDAKISQAIEQARAEGRNVIIVSTYRSSWKIRPIQDDLNAKHAGDDLAFDADIIMNDEAHNILGQKNAQNAGSGEQPDTGADTDPDADESDEINDEGTTGMPYISYSNEIPGSIQAKHRLYMTATPVVEDGINDRSSDVKHEGKDAAINDLKRRAGEMQEDKNARMTVYSTDTAVVGKVSGLITKNDAVAADCLVKTDYAINTVRRPDPEMISKYGIEPGIDPSVYSAIVSSVNAAVADKPETGNGSQNILVYCGSIKDTDSYKKNFQGVVDMLAPDSMDMQTAMADKDSSEPDRRRTARIWLLSDKNSSTDKAIVTSASSESTTTQRTAARNVFDGNAAGGWIDRHVDGWNPRKRFLANVDLYGEGVSKSAIDTVVIADHGKTSERALTQAVGRSSRIAYEDKRDENGEVVLDKNGDPVKVRVEGKNMGHVIIPKIVDENGHDMSDGLPAAAAYGITRFERSVTPNKLRGKPVAADDSTEVMIVNDDGARSGSVRAADIAHDHKISPDELVADMTVDATDRVMRSASKTRPADIADQYRRSSQSNRANETKTTIVEKINKRSGRRMSMTADNVRGMDGEHVSAMWRTARIASSALRSGDYSLFDDDSLKAMIRSNMIMRDPSDPSVIASKSKFIADHADKISSILTNYDMRTDAGPLIPEAFNERGNLTMRAREVKDLIMMKTNDHAFTDSILSTLRGYAAEAGEATPSSRRSRSGRKRLLFSSQMRGLWKAVTDADAEEQATVLDAVRSGGVGVIVDKSVFSSNGVMKTSAQDSLLDAIQ
jgi:hypothetical protein